MQKKKKKIAKLTNGNQDDPFAANEDGDVERIAKELEAKYVSVGERGRLFSFPSDRE